MLLRHFFVSYSTRDAKMAERLRADLAASGVPVWQANRSVKPGTPDWERSIRDALREAYGVFLLASPDAARSRYVPDEIALASERACPIFPAWIAGDAYLDCVPLGMGRSQYIDLRGSAYADGLQQLVEQAGQCMVEQTPRHQLVPGFYRNNVSLPSHLLAIFPLPPWSPTKKIYADDGAYGIEDIQDDDAVVVYPAAYPNLRSLLDEIYIRYLRERFPPLTYGSRWLLQRHLAAYPELVAPPDWFFAAGCQPAPAGWTERTSLRACRMVAGSHWEIGEIDGPNRRACISKDETICLLCNDRKIVDAVTYDDLGKNLYYSMQEFKILAPADPATVQPEAFPNCAIIRAPRIVRDEGVRVLVQEQRARKRPA